MCSESYPEQAIKINDGYKNVITKDESYLDLLNDLAKFHENCNLELSKIFHDEQQDLLG